MRKPGGLARGLAKWRSSKAYTEGRLKTGIGLGKPVKYQYAERMRRQPTQSEAWARKALDAHWRTLGYKFKSQYVIRGFIADFYAPSKKIALEIDGGYHIEILSEDLKRDLIFADAGVRVIRIPNTQSYEEMEVALLGALL